MRGSANIVIVGGGAIGLGLAYHLGLRGVQDVVLLERNQLTSGTSWHAAGIVGPLRATLNATKLAMYAGECARRLEAETGMSTGYRQTGGFWLATRPERMDELRRIKAIGDIVGLEAALKTPEEAVELCPGLDATGLHSALHVAEDASINPVDLCMAYARAARSLGVEIIEGARVGSLLTDDGRITGVETSDGVLKCRKAAVCAGAWSRRLAQTAGASVPLQAVEHMYIVTEPILDLPDPMPVIRSLDERVYIKGDAGRLVIGGFEPHAKCWDAFGPEGDRPFLELGEDWEQFGPFMDAAVARWPALAKAGVQRFMNGPESFTPDTRPLIGETPEVSGLFVAAGFNSVGVMSSAGVGRLLAEWMINGRPVGDVWDLDIARMGPDRNAERYLRTRMREAVADQFEMHWPYKQPTFGRDLYQTPLHDSLAEAGAVFGVTAGWERPIWFGEIRPYSVGDQPWWEDTAREATEMAHGVALVDLSPFSKFDVEGERALETLQRLCSSNVDVEPGRVVYTQMLNLAGGIGADLTLIRTGKTSFRVTSGAATRWKDLAHLRRAGLEAKDVTRSEATIGVMGPGSRTLLQKLCDTDLSNPSFPFATSRMVAIAGIEVRATRISYVGELGWELSVRADAAGELLENLRTSDASFLGHYALDACRVEKAFRHWGHDIGPDVTPLAARLAFTLDWSKPFRGRDALLAERAAGPAERFLQFAVEGEPLLLHDEPIFEGTRHVGLTTSGARGPRTGLMLSLGYVAVERGETLDETVSRHFEINVAGRRYPAQALKRPAYDPDGRRMRS
ncbi:MAG: FAD-dependent oxidoreductase [Pseudomonadota bacterium]